VADAIAIACIHDGVDVAAGLQAMEALSDELLVVSDTGLLS
jgi:hypothetical protein